MTRHHPDTAPLIDTDTAVFLWGDVIKGFSSANKRLHQRIRDQFCLTPAEAEAIINLRYSARNRASLSSLAHAAQFTSGGFTKVSERLCKRGLAQRKPSTSDRRVIYLELTPQGKTLASEMATLIAQVNREQFLDVLGEERAHAVARAMRTIYQDQQTRATQHP